MRPVRSMLGILLVASGLAGGPATADAAPVQHVRASARAALVRVDPRPTGVSVVESLGSSLADVSTTGLSDANDASSRAAGASEETSTPWVGASLTGSRADQIARGSDNPSPQRNTAPGGLVTDAHARLIDLAAGICPAAGADGTRVVASGGSTVSGATAGPLTVLGVSSSRSKVALAPGEDGLRVRATATADLAAVEVLDTYRVRFLGTPTLVADAAGVAGGATIAYTAPVVEITDLSDGRTVARLDAAQTSVDLVPSDASYHGFNPVVQLRLGAPHGTIAAADGRYVRTEADVLHVRLLDTSGGVELFNAHVGALAATAAAPDGGVATCDGGASRPVDRSVPRVLVYERSSGWEHTSVWPASQEIAKIANASGAFTVEFTSDASFLRPDVLAQIDAVYFNSTTGVFPWSSSQKELFERWLLCGGGTIGTHAASDANHGTWPLWQELIGAEFVGHPHMGYFPTLGDATVIVEDRVSPLTEPWHDVASFRWAEEYYKFKTDPRGTQDVHVLLSLAEETAYPYHAYSPHQFLGPYMHRQPLAWTKTFRGAGRVFYTAFGHNGFAWDQPSFRTHMERGARWVTQVRPDPACVM